MESAAQGRFCKSCNQTVTDFTWMTATELIRYFETNKGKTGCGRFRDDQLSDPDKNKSPWHIRLRYLLSLAIIPFLSMFSPQLKAADKVEMHSKNRDRELGPGPTVSHYHSKLLARKKKRKRGRSTGMGAYF
jgi:hypothetical protein